jgi:hypothetical protein
MDPKVVLVLTWVVAGLVVAAYIWFVVWRFRVDRRKKEAQALADGAMSDVIAKTAQRLSSMPATPTVPPVQATPSAPTDSYAISTAEVPRREPPPLAPTSEATVASLVSGIALPHDLAPLTTMAPRPAVGDRVAFWTDRAPAEIVGPAFATELERLGYRMVPLDERTLSAQRDNDRLLVVVHPDADRAIIGGTLAFTSVPERSVVIEVWVPA